MGTVLRQLLPIIIMTAVLYLVLVIPQNRKRKEYNSMMAGLRVNDEIITNGGLIGKITAIQDDYFIIQCGPDKTRLKLTRTGVFAKLNPMEKDGAEAPGYKHIKEGDNK